jgi:hypothetical protein
MNTLLDLIASVLALTFRVITAPLLLVLLFIGGLLNFVQALSKVRMHITLPHLRLNKISFPFRHLQFLRH